MESSPGRGGPIGRTREQYGSAVKKRKVSHNGVRLAVQTCRVKVRSLSGQEVEVSAETGGQYKLSVSESHSIPGVRRPCQRNPNSMHGKVDITGYTASPWSTWAFLRSSWDAFTQGIMGNVAPDGENVALRDTAEQRASPAA